MKLLILSASPKKKAAPPVSSQGYSDCFFRRPKGSGAPQLPAGFPADSGTVSRHGRGVPFRTSLCG